MTVMAGLCIEKGNIMEVQKHISADNRVFAVYDVTGDWDSMVLARVKNREDLDDLTKTVFTLKGISTFVHSCCTKHREGIRGNAPRGMMVDLPTHIVSGFIAFERASSVHHMA